jgi:hypothetical protein
MQALHRAGPVQDEVRSALASAAREDRGSRRARAAEAIQDGILRDATIVPIARVDAWIVTAPGLAVEPGASPSLGIARAGWLP